MTMLNNGNALNNTADTLLVSVVTQVLNGNKYMEDCIQSVLRQSYPYIEHVIVDGGSTDGTLNTLTKYRSMYPNRIRFTSEPDKSAWDGWTKGLRAARGSILGWLGSDDIYKPDAVQTVVEFFRTNQNAYFVFGGCNYINERGEFIKEAITKDFDLKEAINDSCHIPCPSAFYKREVIEKVRYEDIWDSEVEYWIRVGKQFNIYRIENILSDFRLNEKVRAHNDMYSFARTSYVIGRRHGAGIFSPCARRYYFAVAMRPLQPVIDPIFHYMSTGNADKGGFLVKATRPLQPVMAFVYHLVTGSKPLGKKKK